MIEIEGKTNREIKYNTNIRRFIQHISYMPNSRLKCFSQSFKLTSYGAEQKGHRTRAGNASSLRTDYSTITLNQNKK